MPMPSNVTTGGRESALARAVARVNRQFPRIQIMLVLGLTSVTGFFTSFVLLRLGVTQMVVRYPIAIAMAYGAFMALIGLWLWLQRNDINLLQAADYANNFRVPGDDGGAGGAVSSGTPDLDGRGIMGEHLSGVRGGGSGGGSGGWDIDLPSIDVDDAIWVVLAIVVFLAGLIAIFYVVYIAPALLAEVLVDGLLAAGLYRTVKHAQGRHWMKTVLRKTVIPAILVLIFFTLGGFFLQKIEPTASSIGEVWRLSSK
jgi:hypothetical protein